MKNISFEKALEKLEGIVETLENGELSLEDSLKTYEEGVKLANTCQEKLEKAKKTIETLHKKKDGSFETKPFKGKNKND